MLPSVIEFERLNGHKIRTDDSWLKIYQNFGETFPRTDLRNDLLRYLEECKENPYHHYSFWAIFTDTIDFTESQFEEQIAKELSSISSLNIRDDRDFQMSLGGKVFYVAGLFPNSRRENRRFIWPTLIFNVSEHIDHLQTPPWLLNEFNLNLNFVSAQEWK
jgi:FPC/CPF motif-containing protein YcgG